MSKLWNKLITITKMLEIGVSIWARKATEQQEVD